MLVSRVCGNLSGKNSGTLNAPQSSEELPMVSPSVSPSAVRWFFDRRRLFRSCWLVWAVPFAAMWLAGDASASPTDKTLADLWGRWQGVWIIRDADYPGAVQVWNVKGNEVSVYDAGRSSVEEEHFALVSPCRVSRTAFVGTASVDGGQGAIVTSDIFVFADDGLHVARAPAAGGFQQGSLVDVCAGDSFYQYDARTDTCERQDATATLPVLTDRAECAIYKGVANVSFVVRPIEGGTPVWMDFYGRALLSQGLVAHIAERRPTFVGATRRADALAQQ
jgi:hypothetical protein